jgi:hypothetical protein
MRAGLRCLAGALIASATTVLAAEPRAALFVNGDFIAGSTSFRQTSTFRELAEDGTIDARYTSGHGTGLEVGIRYRVSRHFGVATTFTASRRDTSADVSGTIPHPLYFGHPRPVEGRTGALSLRRRGAIFDLVFGGSAGPVELMLFGGAAFLQVESDLVTRIDYTQAYPFDTAQFVGAPTAAFRGNAIGPDAGAGIDVHLGAHFGLGGQVRYSQAKPSLVPQGGVKVQVEAGGVQAGGGLRVYF